MYLHSRSQHSMMVGRSPKGKDWLLTLQGNDQIPCLHILTERTHPDEYSGPIFTHNKDSDKVKRKGKGAMAYLVDSNVIVGVHCISGPRACVEILYPTSRRGEQLEIDSRSAGFYIEQQKGTGPCNFLNCKKRKLLDLVDNTVAPIPDQFGFLRASIKGPDIVKLQRTPAEVAEWKDRWTKREPLPKGKKLPKIMTTRGVYVHVGGDSTNTANADAKNFFSVPVGSKITAGNGTSR